MNNPRVLALVSVKESVPSEMCDKLYMPTDRTCPGKSSCPTGHGPRHWHGHRRSCYVTLVPSTWCQFL